MYFHRILNNVFQGAALASILFISDVSFAQTNPSVTIDMMEEFQHISGFGGANIPGWIDDLNADQVDKAFGNAPGQIGLSILRIRIPNSAADFNLHLPTAVRAKSLGATIIASPWSPPASMKSNNSIVGGFLNPESYGAYADHLLGFADFMESGGAPLYAVSIQNEPDVTVTYESCDWTPAQMVDFLKEQGPKFNTIHVIASESYHFDKSQTDPVLNDAEAEQHVDIIGGHIYGGGLSDYPLAREKGKEVWMTEHFTDSDHSANEWPLALSVGNEIHNCMTANYSAYIWWYVRRFYGLIGDDGNITKRGYVMSHYAKFICPGSTRVGVSPNSVSNVSVTAYKTDSSFVVVAVNRNTNSTEVDFELQNGTVDTLKMYTTTGSKNIENGGVIITSNGSFSANLDAQSVTTFTSFTGNAGGFNNASPDANAGPDQILTDIDNDGVENLLLDGSGSSDSDGYITNYSWALDNRQIAWSQSPSVDLSTGTHAIVLTVTDNDGATNADTVEITVHPGSGNTDLWLEAECGVVGSNWNAVTDPDASNGLYVTARPGIENINNPSENSQDHIVITFEISESGSFKLWGRAKVPTADDDSFWLKMDDGSWIKWNSISGGTTWQWDDVHDSDHGGDFVTYDLAEGSHTLVICHREDGAGLDKFYLTKSAGTPSSMGGAAGNCAPEGNHELSGADGKLIVYPNPAGEILIIETEGLHNPENELYLYNSLGVPVKVIALYNKSNILDVSGLPKGLYLLKITTPDDDVFIEKFLKM